MLFTLNESFGVFVNEILLPEYKGRVISKLLELPWNDETETETLIMNPRVT